MPSSEGTESAYIGFFSKALGGQLTVVKIQQSPMKLNQVQSINSGVDDDMHKQNLKRLHLPKRFQDATNTLGLKTVDIYQRLKFVTF